MGRFTGDALNQRDDLTADRLGPPGDLGAGQALDVAVDRPGSRVVLKATHTCMTIRGIRKPDSVCTTSAMRGSFITHESTRAEFMALISSSH